MFFFQASRGHGKTRFAVEWAIKHKGVLLMRNALSRDRIRSRFGPNGSNELLDEQVLTWEEAREGFALRGSNHYRPAMIDDVDQFLIQHFRHGVEGATSS